MVLRDTTAVLDWHQRGTNGCTIGVFLCVSGIQLRVQFLLVNNQKVYALNFDLERRQVINAGLPAIYSITQCKRYLSVVEIAGIVHLPTLPGTNHSKS